MRCYYICWYESGEPWPDCDFDSESDAKAFAELLRESIGSSIAVISCEGRVVERYAPLWAEPYPPWSSQTTSGREFWLRHPEIRSSDVATEHYFMSSTSAVSALARHWPSAETMWTRLLGQSEYAGARAVRPASLPCRTPPERSLPLSPSGADGALFSLDLLAALSSQVMCAVG